MRIIYGDRWCRNFSPQEVAAAKRLWARKLFNWSHKEVMQAMDKVIDRHPHHPPTLGEFLGLIRVEPAHREVMFALPAPTDPEKTMQFRKQLAALVEKMQS